MISKKGYKNMERLKVIEYDKKLDEWRDRRHWGLEDKD